MIRKKPQKYLGPSQFAAALGLNQFQTPEDLKSELENGKSTQTTKTQKFGIDHEAIARYCYQKQTGRFVVKANWRTYHLCRRIGGICDGMIINPENMYPIKGILEIKCHPGKKEPLNYVPIYYLVQMAGYLALYGAPWCDFMSCCFDEKGNVSKYNIIRITWNDVKDRWENEWFPTLKEFTDRVKWKVLLV